MNVEIVVLMKTLSFISRTPNSLARINPNSALNIYSHEQARHDTRMYQSLPDSKCHGAIA